MGIIDVAVCKGYNYSEYGDHETEYLSLKYFKLMSMGAYIVGAADKYMPPEEEKPSGCAAQL